MYMSKITGKTLKDIEESFVLESQKLLIRSAMFRHIEPGKYSILPLGVKVLEKLTKYIERGLEKLNFQKINLHSDDFIKDAMLSIRSDIKSYKELPASFYDVKSLVRNNIKVKDGLLKSKNYKELKGISFYPYIEGLPKTYNDLIEEYKELLKNLNLEISGMLDYNPIKSNRTAHSFIVKHDKGDRTIYKCPDCGYTALEEIADYHMEKIEINDVGMEEVLTPNIKTIKELEEFLGIKANKLAKTLLVKAKDEIIAVVIRGDRELNLYKLSRVLNVMLDEIVMAEAKDIEHLDTVTGFVGPIGLDDVKIIIDEEVIQGGAFVVGANKKDYHMKNVVLSRDVKNYIVAQVSYINRNDKCPLCKGSLEIEGGFKLGGVYSLGNDANIKNLNYKDQQGKTKDMFCLYHYIDLYTLLSLIVEKNHDDYGIIWPKEIAPYEVLVSVLNVKNQDKLKVGEDIYKMFNEELRIDAMLDDRNERAGFKFKDADLIGFPVRIIVGKKAEEGIVEYKERWKEEKEELFIDEAFYKAIKLLR